MKVTNNLWRKLAVSFLALPAVVALAQAPQEAPPAAARDLFVTVGKSLIVDSPLVIERVAVSNPEIAEAIAVSPREVLINGRAAGETSLLIWQQGGSRLIFDLNVRRSTVGLETARQQLKAELPGQDVNLTFENNIVWLRGTVNDLTGAARAQAIAGTVGKTVNLLHVKVPESEAQILLKVRFANVDRKAQKDLGANWISTGAGNTIGTIGTGQFTRPTVDAVGADAEFTLSDALNVFLFRPDLNIGTTIQALQTKSMLEILAEPNVLAINGKQASFLAGGEFPFPTLQGGASVGSVTIQFREFGVRLTFLPTITPRGAIRLQVTPEVSSLDYANGLTYEGFSIPALSTRRIQTEIELENRQSFAIAGLLDNRVTETLEKIPGLGDIPLLGKLFQSMSRAKNNTELLILVTPEIVRPIPAGQKTPEIGMPIPFLEDAPTVVPRTPGIEETGPVPVRPPADSIRIEDLLESLKPGQGVATPNFTPTTGPAATPAPQPATPPAPAAKSGSGTAG